MQVAATSKSIDHIRRLPVLAMDGEGLFPGHVAVLPGLDDFSPKAFEAASRGSLRIAVVNAGCLGAQKHTHAIEAQVTGIVRLPNGQTGAVVRGIAPVQVLGLTRRSEAKKVSLTALVLPMRRGLRLLPGRGTGVEE